MLFTLAIALLFAQAAGQTPQPSSANAAVPDAKSPEKCTVQGKAVNAVTGEPLKKADISLQGANAETAMSNTTVLTGPDGTFTFKDVDPGTYRIRANRTGFAPTYYGAKKLSNVGTEVRLTAGQAMTDLVLSLQPQAVVTGRITDSDGDPVAGVNVALTRTYYRNGQRAAMDASSASTNDLGEYRIFGVTAGKYRMRAVWRNMGAANGPQEYAPTYYPGQSDPSAASVIELHAGQTLRGLDMVVQRTVTHHVRGKVLVAGSNTDFIQVMVTSRDPGDTFMTRQSAPVRAAKPVFDLHLGPGAYNLTAFYNDGDGMVSGIAQVDVGDSDVDNVVIEPHPGADISGHLRIEGASDLSGIAQSAIRVGLYPKDNVMFFGSQPGRVNADGTFAVKNVGPQTLNVNVMGLPTGYYVKSITYGQQDAKDDGLTYTGPTDVIDILVSPKGATVNGTVHNHKGEPVAGATVVLAPPPVQRSNARGFRVARTDQSGKFTMSGLEPNEYTAFAWEDIEPGEYADPDLLKTVENSGKTVKLEEGSQESLDIESIPAEDTPAAF